ncbi:MAG TPA: response regulator [Mycobacterium sp.]|nr:response regulator [Mycobacterium sp.]
MIDDDREVRDTIADVLRFDGFDVQTASDGRDALALVSRNPYDLIFCDLRMPEMDGRAFYEHIQRDCPRALRRLVFVTGEAQAFQYAAFLRDTGIPVLEKPVTFQQLKNMVDRMAGQGAMSGRRRLI